MFEIHEHRQNREAGKELVRLVLMKGEIPSLPRWISGSNARSYYVHSDKIPSSGLPLGLMLPVPG
jgi:hypothetical protein